MSGRYNQPNDCAYPRRRKNQSLGSWIREMVRCFFRRNRWARFFKWSVIYNPFTRENRPVWSIRKILKGRHPR